MSRSTTGGVCAAFLAAAGLILVLGAGATACRGGGGGDPSGKDDTGMAQSMNPIAEQYVRLVLALGEHDPDYVDAYYGPQEWSEEAKTQRRPLDAIHQEAGPLVERLRAIDLTAAEELVGLRRDYLRRQLEALIARVEILQGRTMTFDEESRALYDEVAPVHPDGRFQQVIDRLDPLLPGKGTLIERYEVYKKSFIIPPEKLGAVFTAAIDEARRRTRAHIDLPDDESFTVEYVTGKSWSAYNWYKGSDRSVIQINTDLPIYIDRAIDLAAHEGYPGHHVYNVLLEENLVRRRGWIEFTVYPLFSPQSLIAEGSANFGIEVAFPGEEQVAFERDVLYPLAGLDPRRAAGYDAVRKLVDELDYAGNEAGRRYLDGTIDAGQAAAYLTRYAMMLPERAAQRVRFLDQYRSYVINYNLGRDLVRDYIERRGGTADHPDARWAEFAGLLSSPRLPSGLR